MTNDAATAPAKPYGIFKASARRHVPVRTFESEAAAVNDARAISRDQGGAAWVVVGPGVRRVVTCFRP